jgi:hypothetical protein
MPNRDLLIAILHEDFLAFVARAFDEVEPRVKLAVENYIRLLAHELTALAAGARSRSAAALHHRQPPDGSGDSFLAADSANYCERLVPVRPICLLAIDALMLLRQRYSALVWRAFHD